MYTVNIGGLVKSYRGYRNVYWWELNKELVQFWGPPVCEGCVCGVLSGSVCTVDWAARHVVLLVVLNLLNFTSTVHLSVFIPALVSAIKDIKVHWHPLLQITGWKLLAFSVQVLGLNTSHTLLSVLAVFVIMCVLL